MSRITSLYGMAALAVALLAATSTLQAQSLTIPTASPIAAQGAVLAPTSNTASVVGPVVTSVGISRSAATSGLENAIQSNPTRRDVAWMVLGGAALVVGSIVGGDGGTIIMVTGGVIGLIGLWRYLQYS